MLSEKEIINSKIGIVANDAGGANYIKAFIDFHSLSPYVFSKGAARKIFNSIKGTKICLSLNEIISKVEVLIFGSGLESGFEIRALNSAKNNVTTITFLDHWTNYNERFMYKNNTVLPDIIVVFDKYAQQLSKIKFPKNQCILLLNNYYIINQISKSDKVVRKENYILFVDEPIKFHSNTKKTHNYDEFTGLNFFLNYVKKSKFRNEKILIRLHPSETTSTKYKTIIKPFDNIYLSRQSSLIEDILKSKFVIGFESMAMVVALELNKPVYNIIPPNCTKTSLPHKEIKYFYHEI